MLINCSFFCILLNDCIMYICLLYDFFIYLNIYGMGKLGEFIIVDF